MKYNPNLAEILNKEAELKERKERRKNSGVEEAVAGETPKNIIPDLVDVSQITKICEEFYGKNTEQMQKLLAEGRVPASIARIMQINLALRNDNTGVKELYLNNYHDTSDLKAQRGDEIKIVLTTYADGSMVPSLRKYLDLINPDEELIDGAVNLGIDNRYDAIQGEGVIVTNRKGLAKVIDSGLTKKQAMDSLFWKVVLRDPDEVPDKYAIPGLHKEVVMYIFSEYRQRFAPTEDINKIKIMGVYPGSISNNVAELRAWCFSGLGYRSYASGGYVLDYGSGRLLGIASETPGAPGRRKRK